MKGPLSAAGLLVLRKLGRADPSEVLRTATQELVAVGAWRLETVERPGGARETWRLVWRMMSALLEFRRPHPEWGKRSVLLVEGAPQLPQAIPLAFVSALISSVPARDHCGIAARELGLVARLIAPTPDVVGIVLHQLEAAGLVSVEEWHVLGERVRRKVRRTPTGDARVGVRGGGDLADAPGVLDTELHVDRWFDSRLNLAFEGKFEAAFNWTWDIGWGAGHPSGGGGGA